MNIFANKTAVENDIETDYIPSGFAVLETDTYPGEIKAVYISDAQNSKAQAVNFIIKLDNGTEFKQKIWVSNKAGELTYKDKTTGKPKNLPGYMQVDAIAMLLVGKIMSKLDTDDRTLNLYDFTAKKEMPKMVPCFVELHNVRGNFDIQKQQVAVTKKNDAGVYVPNGEVKDINELIKAYPEDKFCTITEVTEFIKSLGGTLNSILDQGQMAKAVANMPAEKCRYHPQWLELNKGKTRIIDKPTAGAGAGGEGRAFTPSAGSTDAAAAAADLFA